MMGLMASLFFACNGEDDAPDPTPATPTITSLTPNTGPVGTEVTITGTNFGTSPTVSFGGTNAPVKAGGTATTITVDVPAGLAAEAANVTVTANNQTSQPSVFTVTEGDPPAPEGPATGGSALDTIAALSSLNTAVDVAKLTAALDDADQVTIFAPSNAAFDSLIADTDGATNLTELVTALGGENALAGILQAHVVADSLPADLIAAQAYETLNDGQTITITTEGDNVFANGAQVTQQIITGNGVIHVIDSVINVGAPSVDPGEPNIVRVRSSADGVGGADVTWTSDNTYILDGFVFVNEGQTLTIQPGTIIKGRPGQGARASALIVARGGTIQANGTAAAPIIFTGEADDLNGSVADDDNALWGGVIILGRATSNNNDTQGLKSIEGIPTEEARGQYGGTADTDNSGSFTYVSIRHGGSLIGADNEINGLTLGSVGSGTTINNVEVFSNLDDGIEFFGGTVNVDNLVIAYPGDDGIDVDEGYRGSVQNAIVWHTGSTLESDDPRGMELDGGVGNNENATPFAAPKMANLTLFYDDEGDANMSDAIYMRDNFAGSIYNSIAVNHDAPIDIERRTDLNIDASTGGSSYDRFDEGTIVVSGNIFYNLNGVTDVANFADLFEISNAPDAAIEAEVETALADANALLNPTFGTGTDKFKPSAAEVTADLAELPADSGLEARTYKGAVDPAAASPYFANWTKMWTVLGE